MARQGAPLTWAVSRSTAEVSVQNVPGNGQRIRWGYRIRQFITRLLAGQARLDDTLARAILPDAAYALFRRMQTGDRLHALQVLVEIRSSGQVPLELEQAALLHDVGKVDEPLTLVHRTLVILLQGLGHGLLERLARDQVGSWRYPFHVQLNHAARGARLCEEIGCSPVVVSLIRHHDSPLSESSIMHDAVREQGAGGDMALLDMLRILQEADDLH